MHLYSFIHIIWNRGVSNVVLSIQNFLFCVPDLAKLLASSISTAESFRSTTRPDVRSTGWRTWTTGSNLDSRQYFNITIYLFIWVIRIIVKCVSNSFTLCRLVQILFFTFRYGKRKGFIQSGDPIVCITGWRQGAGSSNTVRILHVDPHGNI